MDRDEPTLALYVPWLQLVQKEEAGAVAYFPATQLTHVIKSLVKEPARQVMHALADVLPSKEFAVPEEQLVQEGEPVAAAYVPVAQFVQLMLPTPDVLPTAQREQEVDPSAYANFPAVHEVQDADPATEDDPPLQNSHWLA